MRRNSGRSNRLAIGLAVALVAAGACSSGGSERSDASDPPTSTSTAAASTATASTATVAPDTSTGPGASAAPTEPPPSSSEASTTSPVTAAFEVPAERLRALDEAGFELEEVDYPEQPADVPWPTARWARRNLRGALARDVDAVVARAFGELSDDTGTIDAIVAVQGGELVVEAYNGWKPGEPHVSWSMAKSITQALVGRLVEQDRLDIWAPIDAPEWSKPDDPRRDITLDHLLRMSSGLRWQEDYLDAEGDVLRMLYGDKKRDRAHFVAAKPLADPVDTVWAYSTGTSNLVARSVAEEVGYGDELVRWADRALFAPLGITSVRHDLDGKGLLNGGSVIDMTPLDFARFGLLYLRDGMWDGERLLAKGWVDYTRMPTPTAGEPLYGAHWWIDDIGPVAFSAQGFNGQTITVVPELDLVVVVLSAAPDRRDNEVREALIEAFRST